MNEVSIFYNTHAHSVPCFSLLQQTILGLRKYVLQTALLQIKYLSSTTPMLTLHNFSLFRQYFQMIRSRVPRSWVERVIEVDDRDPAILDLDPNKPLSAQIEEEEVKEILGTSEIATIDSTPADSLNDSERSITSRTSERSSVSRKSERSSVYRAKYDSLVTTQPADKVTEAEQTEQKANASGEVEVSEPPITQIDDEPNDERSDASSITTGRDNNTNAESSTVDLAKISAFLDRIESKAKTLDAISDLPQDAQKQGTSRFSSTEEIENKLANLIERFGSESCTSKEAKDDVPVEQKNLLEKSQSDIAKLSALLAAKVGDSDKSTTSDEVTSNDQPDLAKLSSLLTDVLSRMEQIHAADDSDSTKQPTNKNAALEALFAKRAALSDEQEKPVRDDPEFQKYFKMLKLGLPRSAVAQALERDGKDATILDLDPNLPLADQKGKNPNKNAALEALFANRAASMQPSDASLPLKNHPDYQKYFKMLKVGMPLVSVKQALERDGKDPAIADLDPEKSLARQTKKEESPVEDQKSDPPLKDDPGYTKFFKVCRLDELCLVHLLLFIETNLVRST